jgi:arabinogalactan oligomer / maltooligosaccharide transport system permease protein
LLLLLVGCAVERSGPEPLRVWHGYRGAEKDALEELVARWSKESGVPVETLVLPYDAYSTKLEAAIPLGEGPHVFVDAHDRLGSYRERKLVAPVGDALEEGAFGPIPLGAVSLGGEVYGVPIEQESLGLYYRTDLVTGPPATFEGMAGTLRAPLPPRSFVLAFPTGGVYAHAALLGAFGGRLLGDDDEFAFHGPEAAASLVYLRELTEGGVVPANADGALVTRLFESGKAAYVMNGPWFASDLPAGVPYAVAKLPPLARTGKPLRPLLTVGAAMLSPDGAARSDARALARFLGSREAAELRLRMAHVVPARDDVIIPEDDAFVRAFAEQAREGTPMPTSVAMRAVWEPADNALRKVIAGSATADEALDEARERFERVRRPLPPPASPAPILVALGALTLAGAFALWRRSRDAAFKKSLVASLPAYRYVAHAVVALGLLVFAPLVAGAAISLFAGPRGSQYYVGFANFWDILSARGGPLFASGTFYLVLLVTVLWTACNLALHVTIGMALGAVLSRPTMRLRALYRVLLILPWAVPNYVTSLAWKGMFQKQFGAVTALTNWLGDALGAPIEPIDWFARFGTAFAANVATNVWLGFPFMMVVTLAAFTSVPKDVLEAAEVDGATRWQRFRLVTLPLIKPSMLPAVALGAIWTFNMFNVVFLVSGGQPDGETDILVSEAYRWAFTRQAQYGYAAAYAVLIFLLLFGVTRLLERRSGARAAA